MTHPAHTHDAIHITARPLVLVRASPTITLAPVWSAQQAGVVDPTKVVRSAIQNAASIASLLLTTEAATSRIPEQQNGAMNGHHHA